MMYYSASDKGILENKIRVLLSGVQPNYLSITSSDALPKSYRRLVGAKPSVITLAPTSLP